jgi:hypothetical protein
MMQPAIIRVRAQIASANGRAHHINRLAPVLVGEWLSLVEHLVRDQGVGGSNPLSPTKFFQSLTTSAKA